MLKSWNLSKKIVVAFSVLIALAAGSLTLGQYWQLRSSLRQAMKERLQDILQLAAPQIDSDYHSLVVSSQDANSVYYRINKKRLESIQSASQDIQHLYTVRQQSNGQYHYILDYWPNPEQSSAMVGHVLESPPQLLTTQTEIQQATTEQDIIPNSSGVPVLYGYVPIKGEFNRLDGLLVIELDARPVLKRESQATLLALMTFIAILLITLTIVWYLAQSLIVSPTLRLNQAAKRLAEGQWDETLPTERTDELGDLARSFNHMGQQLKLSFGELADYSQNLEHKVEERTQELSESKQLLDLVINNIPQSVFWKNRDNVYLGCNQSFAKAAGMAPKDITGKTDYDLSWSKEETEFYIICDRRVMESGTPELGNVVTQVQENGEKGWLETSKVPLYNPQGQVMGLIGIFQDITPYKEAESAAQQASQAKSEFLSSMSHELRTPLNGILGYAQILSRAKELPEHAQRGISIIHECGTHLLTLINDILDLAKIEARKLDLNPIALHLPSLLQSVVEMCKIRADAKGLEFHYQPSSRLPEGIVTDEKRLRQVLINLLGNAIKFTANGSVALRVDVLAILDQQVTLLFQVIDTGAGIAKADLSKIFQAFEQAGDRQKRSEGTGLGLSISQQIVHLMGSQIQINSELGQGSEFFFTVELPLAENWAEQQGRIEGGDRIIGYKGTRQQILVIDDRWENRAVVRHLLTPLGFIIIEAENGQVGLEKLRSEQPDLVITDLAMPVIDGFEFLKCVRSDPALINTQVIVSSASVSQTDQQMALDAGGDSFLIKPVDANTLFHTISTDLNLTWIYAPQDTQNHLVTTPTELVMPPDTTLEVLLTATEQGLVVLLRDQLEQLIKTDQRYRSFAEPILQLARQFMFDEIEVILQQYLAQ